MESKKRNSGENLMLSISRLWEQDSPLYFDTKIICQDGEFLWNRLMLAATSSFLASVLDFREDLLDNDACLFFPDFTCNIVKSVLISFIKKDETMRHSSLDALQKFVGTVRIGLHMIVDGKTDIPVITNGNKEIDEDAPIESFDDNQGFSDDHFDFSDANKDEDYLDNFDEDKNDSCSEDEAGASEIALKKPRKRCGSCSGCLEAHNCGNCAPCGRRERCGIEKKEFKGICNARKCKKCVYGNRIEKRKKKKRGRPRARKIPDKFQRPSTPNKVGRPKIHPIRDRPFSEDATKEGSTWKCRHCGETFTLKKYMSDHLRNNHPEIMNLLWVCEICASVHRSKTSFDYHIETHNENIVLCEVCNKTYNNLRLLKQHQKVYHNGSDSRFVCSQCGKQVESNYKLQKHIESVHERLRRWKCTKCDGCYLSRNNWMRHCKVRYGSCDDSMLQVLSVEEARAVPPYLMNPPNPESRYQKKKLKKKKLENREKAIHNFKIMLPDPVKQSLSALKDKPQFAFVQNIQEVNKDVIVHLKRLGSL